MVQCVQKYCHKQCQVGSAAVSGGFCSSASVFSSSGRRLQQHGVQPVCQEGWQDGTQSSGV